MRKNNNTIEINGHRYDAVTGAKIGSAPHKTKPTSTTHHAKTHKAVVRSAKPAPKTSRHTSVKHPAKPAAAHRPAKSRTLARQGLKKPSASLKRQQKVQGKVGAIVPESFGELMLEAPGQLDEKRLRHAKRVHRSRLISHFPAAASNTPARSSEPPISLPKKIPPEPAARKKSTSAHSKRKDPAADMLDRAVERATSHLQPPPKRRHEKLKRNLGAGAAVGLSILILGVIVAQNSTNVRLQMASAKAGFDVSLPSYQPNGYAPGALNYSDGVAAVRFNNAGNHYTITQKPTKWNDLGLRDNFVAPNYPHYRTAWAGSQLVYIYGDQNASWVSNGVWYIVQTDGSLSDSQLTKLAASL